MCWIQCDNVKETAHINPAVINLVHNLWNVPAADKTLKLLLFKHTYCPGGNPSYFQAHLVRETEVLLELGIRKKMEGDGEGKDRRRDVRERVGNG